MSEITQEQVELELEREKRKALQEMLRSEGWKVRAEIFNALMLEFSDATLDKEGVELYRAQGAVRALTRLHNLIIGAGEEEEE